MVETQKLYQQLEELQRQHRSFKKRISVIINLLIPGIGFFVYGSAYWKGLITLVLFIAYNFLFFNNIVEHTDPGIAVLYYMPAVIIWIASIVMVAILDD